MNFGKWSAVMKNTDICTQQNGDLHSLLQMWRSQRAQSRLLKQLWRQWKQPRVGALPAACDCLTVCSWTDILSPSNPDPSSHIPQLCYPSSVLVPVVFASPHMCLKMNNASLTCSPRSSDTWNLHDTAVHLCCFHAVFACCPQISLILCMCLNGWWKNHKTIFSVSVSVLYPPPPPCCHSGFCCSLLFLSFTSTFSFC